MCRPGELGRDEVEAWHRFQSHDLELQNPFLSPEFAQAVDAVRPDVRVAVLEQDGCLAGFLAFSAGRYGVARPVAAGVCDLQGFVHHPEAAWEPAALMKACGLRAWRFDHLIGAQSSGVGAGRAESWVIDLSDSWDGYRSWAKAERGRYLNWLERKQRRFERDHPDFAFSYGGADPDGRRALVELKSAQCRRMGWDDFLGRPWIRELIERLAVVDTPALAGGLSALRAGSRVVAADFSLRSTSVYAGWLIAYDPTLSTASPGAVRWYHVLRAAAGDGIRRVDLGKGGDDFKHRFSTGTVGLAEGLWTAEGPLPAALQRADGWGRSVRARHHRGEQRLRGAVRAARRWRDRLAGNQD